LALDKLEYGAQVIKLLISASFYASFMLHHCKTGECTFFKLSALCQLGKKWRQIHL